MTDDLLAEQVDTNWHRCQWCRELARGLCGCDAETRIATLTADLEAAQVDARRYRWLRQGLYPLALARSVLNDTPHGIDAAIDAAMGEQTP